MVQAAALSPFEMLLARSGNPLGTAVLLILAWIAASDGEVEEAEHRQLEEIARASEHAAVVDSIIACAKGCDLRSLQLACELLREHFPGEKAALFVEMAVGLVVADGFMRPSENFILRFIADLMGVNRSRLNSIFMETTGRELPEPSDPSSAAYWQAHERARRNDDNEASGSSEQNQRRASLDARAMRAYAVLGLEDGASIEEVKRAYRRLAQVHHPDKFSALGKEAVAAATNTFQRIQDAYQYLVDHA
jgi:DnaJ like chaperone protein